MQFARLLIATGVLATLGGTIWWTNKHDPKPDPSPENQIPGAPKSSDKKAAGPVIISINEADVAQIQVEHAGQPPVVAAYEKSAGWHITAPQTMQADQAAWVGIAATATNLASDRVIDDNAAGDDHNLTSYGLNPPLTAVKFTMKNGSVKRLRVGEDTPDGSGTYASVDGDNRLFTMPVALKMYFDKRLLDLREKHLLQFKAADLKSLELNVTGKPPLEFTRNDSQWRLTKPRTLRADGAKVDELVEKLRSAQMTMELHDGEPAASSRRAPKGKTAPVSDDHQTEQQIAAQYASAKSVVKAKLTTAAGGMTIEIRKSGMDYFASATGVNTNPGIYQVGADMGEAADKTLDDFRNKKLFSFGFDDPTRIGYSAMGQTRVIEKSGSKWLSDGREMDSVAVQNLLDKLRDLAASRLDDVPKGLAGSSATIEWTVVSKGADAKDARTEKVHISPSGKEFAARRDDDTTSYILDSAAVTGLTEAVNGVREAQVSGTK